MSLITLDFETYYDKEYSLSKMTTEEYVRDERFQVIGVGVKVDDGPAFWVDDLDDGVVGALTCLDLEEHYVLCHNMMFDGAILGWHYDIHPTMLLDTLSMARYQIRDPRQSMSLANLAKLYDLGEKGTEVVQALGKRLTDFDPDDLDRYGRYCCNDVEITYKLFNVLVQNFPPDELKIIDQTLRMYTMPMIQLDRNLLETALTQERKRRKDVLNRLLQGAPVEELQTVLRKRDNMAALLQTLGVYPPMKISPTTKRFTYAFAKGDKQFTRLLEHPNEEVRALVEAKLEVSSSIEETRLERFLGIEERGPLPVALKYCGAHTGRYSGMEKTNLQNLPRRSALREALIAPEGYQFVVSDASQIEARLMAYCAGQDDMVQQFRDGVDVYCAFGEHVFGREITKEDAMERFCCKVSILQLQYGSGSETYYNSLTNGSQGMKIDITREEADRIHAMYRSTYRRIRDFWYKLDKMLKSMANGGSGVLLHEPLISYSGTVLHLPEYLSLHYPNLCLDEAGEFRYLRYRNGGTSRIYGAMMAENIMQALARQFIMGRLLEIMEKCGERGFDMNYVLQVHDELVFLVEDSHVHTAWGMVNDIMSTPPEWAPDLPVACETGIGGSYGTAK